MRSLKKRARTAPTGIRPDDELRRIIVEYTPVSTTNDKLTVKAVWNVLETDRTFQDRTRELYTEDDAPLKAAVNTLINHVDRLS